MKPLFEWDENKRLATRQARGLDFADAPVFFDGRPVIHMPSVRGGEDRWRTTTVIQGAHYTLVWMWRGEAVRIISMRRAHEDEERAYGTLHG
jgi:uncharacterized DUF497 family protein